jgi:hypothetical protein
MKTVYICAPFRASEKRTQQENIDHALSVGRKFKHQVVPVIPHIALAYIDEASERELALKHCLVLLERCDEVWICSQHIGEITEGMIEEMGIAVFNKAPMGGEGI